ncbi:hypothetical protein A2153_03665 [Candidatus Gottesmanbacteria bacterium RBG_16_38_7b]|uniref:ECF transporter S component n=1 Tax=Candidatus Gottesmanbacteria bacterium RBG_16_38_7b TaxID=1798372 RepID=A0A1F5YHI1_9BACT|nr:MAG: hypothetical protein A2153_03665 [Candidatus Gottesmanbacteria bacterium RBG_16_38_7b]
MKKTYRQKFIFTGLLILLGLISLQIPFTRLLGANVRFTLYDFIAPTLGVFLSTVPGIIAVLFIQLFNFLIHPDTLTGLGSVIRLFPVLFAVFYFNKKREINLLIPLVSIFIFILHPVGRTAWQYSLLWLIPVLAHYFRKNLYIRSLGATFTAHSVGGALWVWAFGLTREMWLALISQTLLERTLMAGGITVSYYALVKLFNFLKAKKILPLPAFSSNL